MKLIIDVNIVFSALITGGFAAKTMASHKYMFYTPFFMFSELIKHKDEIQSKSKYSQGDFDELLNIILTKLKFIDVHKKFTLLAEKIAQTKTTYIISPQHCSLIFQFSLTTND